MLKNIFAIKNNYKLILITTKLKFKNYKNCYKIQL